MLLMRMAGLLCANRLVSFQITTFCRKTPARATHHTSRQMSCSGRKPHRVVVPLSGYPLTQEAEVAESEARANWNWAVNRLQEIRPSTTFPTLRCLISAYLCWVWTRITVRAWKEWNLMLSSAAVSHPPQQLCVLRCCSAHDVWKRLASPQPTRAVLPRLLSSQSTYSGDAGFLFFSEVLKHHWIASHHV